MNRLTRFYKLTKETTKATHLKAEIYYSLGGYNYFSHKQESRGYYMSIVPVRRCVCDGVITESFTAFTGLKMCVLPVSRKSAKKMDEAVKYFNEHVEDFMKTHFGQYEVDLINYTERAD